MGDPDGDMVLEFEGYKWKVKEDIVAGHFKWMNFAFPDRLPVGILCLSDRLAANSALGKPNHLFRSLWRDQPRGLLCPPRVPPHSRCVC